MDKTFSDDEPYVWRGCGGTRTTKCFPFPEPVSIMAKLQEFCPNKKISFADNKHYLQTFYGKEYQAKLKTFYTMRLEDADSFVEISFQIHGFDIQEKDEVVVLELKTHVHWLEKWDSEKIKDN